MLGLNEQPGDHAQRVLPPSRIGVADRRRLCGEYEIDDGARLGGQAYQTVEHR